MTMKLFFALLVIPLASAKVLRLTEDNFSEKTAGKSVFIKFFAPWCGHCKKMAPDWERLAKDFDGHKVGLVAEVDCTAEDGQGLCEDFDVQGFPTLYYGDPLSPERYEGARDYEALSAHAKEHITKPICSIQTLDACSKEQKKTLADLQKKSKDELEKMEGVVDKQLQEAQETFDKGVDEINNQYEALVDKYNAQIDEIRDKTDYKWIQQVLQSMEKKGDEL